MTKGWQLVVATPRPRDANPVVEHFIVAVFDQDGAVEALRKRKKLGADAKVLAFGPEPEQTMAFLNAERGGIYAASVLP